MTATHRNFAIVIGINAYQAKNGIKSLGTAVNDARAIAKLLREDYQYLQIWELSNQQASYESIVMLLKKTLAQTVGKKEALDPQRLLLSR